MFLPLIYDMASNLNISGDLGNRCSVQPGRERLPLSWKLSPHLTPPDPVPHLRTQPLSGGGGGSRKEPGFREDPPHAHTAFPTAPAGPGGL